MTERAKTGVFSEAGEQAVALLVSDLDERVIPLSETADGVTLMKELIYDGDFVKDVGKSNEIRFSVTPKLRQHWIDQHEVMTANGVKVPLPLEHTVDPEKNRGYLLNLKNGIDSKGRNALFGVMHFPNKDDASRLTKTADVSIYVPPSSQDGKGNQYHRPIKHVAFTTYPVIPDLDGFTAIAASFAASASTNDAENDNMNALSSLATKLGIQLSNCASNEQAESAIIAAYEAHAAENAPGLALSDLPEGVAANMMKLTKNNRSNAIKNLHTQRHINRATADGLTKIFCSDSAVELSLSQGDGDDQFDGMIRALKQNTRANRELTHEQVLALSDSRNGGGSNILLDDTKRRVQAANN